MVSKFSNTSNVHGVDSVNGASIRPMCIVPVKRDCTFITK